MRLLLGALKILALLIVLATTAALLYLYLILPKKEEPQNIQLVSTPEQLARGEYLARHVNVCLHCHANRNMQFFANPPIPGTEGQGSLFIKEEGLGEMYSPNITPHAIGDWTDGEIIRAVTAGVNKDGDPLFPIMPYQIYANLKLEDLHAVIVYIRTLKPIQNEVPRTKLNFPLNLIVRMIPVPQKANVEIQSNPGYYLATVAGCINCHTPVNDRGEPLPEMILAGGQTFGNVQSANITPDNETGIGKWSKEDFIAAFKKWQDPALQHIVMPQDRNTVMPWIDYSGMNEEDLGYIYDYLRTVPPIRNSVEKFPVPVK